MTTNAIPAPVMDATARAIDGAKVWKAERAAQALNTGDLAFAADVVDRLNGEGYVVARGEAIQVLWHENEHLKQRLAEFRLGVCSCGQFRVGAGMAVGPRVTGPTIVHRVGHPCFHAEDY